MKTLFEVASVGHGSDAVFDWHLAEEAISSEGVGFAREIVDGVLDKVEAIDAEITTAAPMWPLGQMAAIDLSLIRMAIWEAKWYTGQTPLSVVISEAVEIAREYGGEGSRKLVNGVLGTVIGTPGRQTGKAESH